MRTLVAVGALIIGILLYFVLKKPKAQAIEEIKKEEAVVAAREPGLTAEEVAAIAAATVAAYALKEAQEAEEAAKVEEQAVVIEEAEKEAEEAAVIVIYDPTAENEAAAQAAEAEAAAARAELEKRWSEALTIAENAEAKAMVCVEEANKAWKAAASKVTKQQEYIYAVEHGLIGFEQPYGTNTPAIVAYLYGDDYRRGKIGKLRVKSYPKTDYIPFPNDAASSLMIYRDYEVTLFVDADYGGRSETFIATGKTLIVNVLQGTVIDNDSVSSVRVRPYTKDAMQILNSLKDVADRIKLELVTAISHANDCIERVLTMTADIRLLGILGARIAKVEAQCAAFRAVLVAAQEKVKAGE